MDSRDQHGETNVLARRIFRRWRPTLAVTGAVSMMERIQRSAARVGVIRPRVERLPVVNMARHAARHLARFPETSHFRPRAMRLPETSPLPLVGAPAAEPAPERGPAAAFEPVDAVDEEPEWLKRLPSFAEAASRLSFPDSVDVKVPEPPQQDRGEIPPPAPTAPVTEAPSEQPPPNVTPQRPAAGQPSRIARKPEGPEPTSPDGPRRMRVMTQVEEFAPGHRPPPVSLEDLRRVRVGEPRRWEPSAEVQRTPEETAPVEPDVPKSAEPEPFESEPPVPEMPVSEDEGTTPVAQEVPPALQRASLESSASTQPEPSLEVESGTPEDQAPSPVDAPPGPLPSAKGTTGLEVPHEESRMLQRRPVEDADEPPASQRTADAGEDEGQRPADRSSSVPPSEDAKPQATVQRASAVEADSPPAPRAPSAAGDVEAPAQAPAPAASTVSAPDDEVVPSSEEPLAIQRASMEPRESTPLQDAGESPMPQADVESGQGRSSVQRAPAVDEGELPAPPEEPSVARDVEASEQAPAPAASTVSTPDDEAILSSEESPAVQRAPTEARAAAPPEEDGEATPSVQRAPAVDAGEPLGVAEEGDAEREAGSPRVSDSRGSPSAARPAPGDEAILSSEESPAVQRAPTEARAAAPPEEDGEATPSVQRAPAVDAGEPLGVAEEGDAEREVSEPPVPQEDVRAEPSVPRDGEAPEQTSPPAVQAATPEDEVLPSVSSGKPPAVRRAPREPRAAAPSEEDGGAGRAAPSVQRAPAVDAGEPLGHVAEEEDVEREAGSPRVSDSRGSPAAARPAPGDETLPPSVELPTVQRAPAEPRAAAPPEEDVEREVRASRVSDLPRSPAAARPAPGAETLSSAEEPPAVQRAPKEPRAAAPPEDAGELPAPEGLVDTRLVRRLTARAAVAIQRTPLPGRGDEGEDSPTPPQPEGLPGVKPEPVFTSQPSEAQRPTPPRTTASAPSSVVRSPGRRLDRSSLAGQGEVRTRAPVRVDLPLAPRRAVVQRAPLRSEMEVGKSSREMSLSEEPTTAQLPPMPVPSMPVAVQRARPEAPVKERRTSEVTTERVSEEPLALLDDGDLAQLAREVLPIVRRLLWMELERRALPDLEW